LAIWRKDPSEKVVDQLYLLTAKEFEYCLIKKLNSCLYELDDEDIAEIIKFFYLTYQRASEEENILSLWPRKIFPIHQDLIEKKGIGILHRALFTTEKSSKRKRKREEDEDYDSEDYENSKIIKECAIEEKKFKEFINSQNIIKLTYEEEKKLEDHIKTILKPKINISDFDKKKEFITKSINYSSILKKEIIIEKQNNPENFFDIDKVIAKGEIIAGNIKSKENGEAIISLLGKYFEKKGAKVYASKKESKIENLEKISIQSIFSFINQKKYEFHFDFGEVKNEKILNDIASKEEFLKNWKTKISKELNINQEKIIITDIQRGSIIVNISFVDESVEETKIKKLSKMDDIQDIKEKPIIEDIIINCSILDSKGDKDRFSSQNSYRGGEQYIPPEGWNAIGLNIDNLYENNNWLGHNNQEGEFAVAYLGLYNIYDIKEQLNEDLNIFEINIRNIIKNMSQNLFENDRDIRHNSQCGNGICLFQNPKYAENTAGIVDLYGFRIKIMLMCRVKPDKIRQPESCRELWILNPTPDEVRPYRILIKRIPFSPLAQATEDTIKLSKSPVDYIISAIKTENLSILPLKTNDTRLTRNISKLNGEFANDDFFVIRLYTSCYFRFINIYLRDNIILDNYYGLKGFSKEQIKSWIYCLQLALSRNKNVEEDTIVYRGVKYPFPKEIGIGSKFYFQEFVSTSKIKEFCFEWIDNKGTIMEIKIKNNGVNGHPNYCYYIENITVSNNQYEVLISSHCYFTVTNIRHENQIDYVSLICEGTIFEASPESCNEIVIGYEMDSTILEDNKSYKNYLIQWLKKPNANLEKKNLKNIRLLYRGSRDGFEARDFHNKCDNKGETLTIIKSDEDFIFGGYTEINWESITWNGNVGENNNARRNGIGYEFVFTLKNPHNIPPSKFNMKQDWLNHSICCDINLGPIFGCNDIRIENNCNSKSNRFTFYDFQPGEYCFDDTTGKKRLLFTGTPRYLVKEIEVFNIIR